MVAVAFPLGSDLSSHRFTVSRNESPPTEQTRAQLQAIGYLKTQMLPLSHWGTSPAQSLWFTGLTAG